MYLIDTWAWIEHWRVENSTAGTYIMSSHPKFASVITLTEVLILLRRTQGVEAAAERVGYIRHRARILDVTSDIAERAGTYGKPFQGGIADRLIYATGEAHGLTLVTGDQHFRGMPDVKYIGT